VDWLMATGGGLIGIVIGVLWGSWRSGVAEVRGEHSAYEKVADGDLRAIRSISMIRERKRLGRWMADNGREIV